jgi:hypothetical protein
MAHLLFGHHSDNVAPNATISVFSGTEDANFPLANLIDLDPSLPGQFTTTTGRVVFDFTTAQRVDVGAIIHHNLTPGLAGVRIEANATNSWGAPSFSASFVIPADHEDDMPVNPWLDLTVLPGYSAGGFRYWSIVVANANAEAIALGEIVLVATKRTLVRNIDWGADEPEEWPRIVHETDFKVKTVYPYGTKQRSLFGNIKTTDAGLAALRSFHRDSFGEARAVLIVPDPNDNDALFARITTSSIRPRRVFLDLNELPFAVEELSRGLSLRLI